MGSEVRSRGYLWETIKTVIVAVIISLVLLLLAALMIGVFNIDSDYTQIINQVIKSISICIACLVGLRLPLNRWLRGFIVGVLYIVLAFFIFSAMAGRLEFGITLLNDVAIGAVVGLISGVVAKLLRREG